MTIYFSLIDERDFDKNNATQLNKTDGIGMTLISQRENVRLVCVQCNYNIYNINFTIHDKTSCCVILTSVITHVVTYMYIVCSDSFRNKSIMHLSVLFRHRLNNIFGSLFSAANWSVLKMRTNTELYQRELKLYQLKLNEKCSKSFRWLTLYERYVTFVFSLYVRRIRFGELWLLRRTGQMSYKIINCSSKLYLPLTTK